VQAEAVEGSDKLWKCQVDVGDAQPRQIVAGLQQHIPLDAMQGMLAVAICNLKAAKLAGQLSEGMLLAASSSDKSLVRTLCPPQASKPGDPVSRHNLCCRCSELVAHCDP
jgi:aminoacyl tRNA synthase complex-interacting multifunctional protein 1